MKEINGYYVDENNNRWNAKTYTKEQALKYSSILLNCSDCIDCSNCSNCRDCRDCRDCRNCVNCRNCRHCSDWKKNPQRYLTDYIGSRNSQTYFYFDKKRVQVVCGCFSGNLIEFEKAVNETHGNNKYAEQYNKQINIVKYLQDQI